MNYLRVFLMLLIVVVFGNLSVVAQDSKESNKNDTSIFERFESPFRYVIIRNEVRNWSTGEYEICDFDEEGDRIIEVLMEEKSFTKENLILLFRLISSRFPKPESMGIFVHFNTDLHNLATPEEGEQGIGSHTPEQRLETSPSYTVMYRAHLDRLECSSKLKCKSIMWMYDKNDNDEVSYRREDVVIEYIDIMKDWCIKKQRDC